MLVSWACSVVIDVILLAYISLPQLGETLFRIFCNNVIMKYMILLSLLLVSCGPAQSYPSRVQVADLDFPLEFKSTPDLPYESGPAFWRILDNAIDIASHCGEIPGDDFHHIEVGDILMLSYENGMTENFVISEIIVVKYISPSDPLNHPWVDVLGNSFTVHEFQEFTYNRPGDQYVVLHSSICDPRSETPDGKHGAVGQTFYIATP